MFINNRQLKICAICFDMAVALLRVIELVLKTAYDSFCDPSLPNTDLLLARLCQVNNPTYQGIITTNFIGC